MPVNRYRRRSSVKLTRTSSSPVKPGNYGISPRNISFAPNVTPVTFTTPADDDSDDLLLASLANGDATSPLTAPTDDSTTLFPPSHTPAPAPARKRCPPGKRRSQGYIPRPPNAFMLFRADFVRQKHVPGSIETNHGSLSKIIGNCWRALPLEEKRIWEFKAKQEKAAHKAQFPNYRFRPVHNKNKDKKKEKQLATEEDERRCEEVAQLLLEGKKGEELAMAVRNLDRERELTPVEHHSHPFAMPMPVINAPIPMHHNAFNQNMSMYPRRPSSVPLPGDFFLGPIAPPQMMPNLLPHQPQPQHAFAMSRPVSPVGAISRHAQHNHHAMFPNDTATSSNNIRGHRRSSSAQPFLRRSWTLPSHWGVDPTSPFDMAYDGSAAGYNLDSLTMPFELERDPSPLPDVDASLFNDGFSFGGGASSVPTAPNASFEGPRGGSHSHSHSLDVSQAPSPASRPASQTPAPGPGGLHLDIPVDPLSWTSAPAPPPMTLGSQTLIAPTDLASGYPSASSTSSDESEGAPSPVMLPAISSFMSGAGKVNTFDAPHGQFGGYELAAYEEVGPTDYVAAHTHAHTHSHSYMNVGIDMELGPLDQPPAHHQQPQQQQQGYMGMYTTHGHGY